MPANRPTILATSGGIARGVRTDIAFAPLIHHAIELSGVEGRRPRLCHVGTAGGDQQWWTAWMDDAARVAGIDIAHLNLFPMPPVDDIAALLLEQDVIWVGGGSVVNLLAVWVAHDLRPMLVDAWRAGVVLTGVSAGSICWHVGGTTDSFGPELRAVTNGLGLVPYSNGVHYDSESRRRPFFQECIATGVLPAGYATDDGVGLVYHDTEFVEAVSEAPGKGAYWVERSGDEAVEERIEPRLLPGAR
jgi:peptidase E